MSQGRFGINNSLRLPIYKITDGTTSSANSKSLTNYAYCYQPSSKFYLICFEDKSIVARISGDVKDQTKLEINALQRSYLRAPFNSEAGLASWDPPVLKYLICALKFQKDEKFTVDELEFKNYLQKSEIPMNVGLEYVYKSSKHRFIPVEADQFGGIVGESTQVIVEAIGSKIPPIKFESQGTKVDFNFSKLGIGGLKSELDTLFRRFFLMRMFSASTLSRLGMKPVKGVVMYGASHELKLMRDSARLWQDSDCSKYW